MYFILSFHAKDILELWKEFSSPVYVFACKLLTFDSYTAVKWQKGTSDISTIFSGVCIIVFKEASLFL